MRNRLRLSYCSFLLLFGGFANSSKAQTLEAHYKVSREIISVGEGGIQKKIATIGFNGVLYERGNRAISYKKPLYRNDYPDGYIHYSTGENSEELFGLVMDTMQGLTYRDFDSLIIRYTIDLPGAPSKGLNIMRPFKKGSQQWQFLSETKDIGGLKCQKAQFTNNNGRLQWVVWFCPDIPVIAGPDGISDLPGLVVEEENKITNETYSLESYNSNAKIPANVFWPDVFNQPFK